MVALIRATDRFFRRDSMDEAMKAGIGAAASSALILAIVFLAVSIG